MKRILLLLMFALAIATTARASVVNDLAGPSDYGATIQPVSYDLAHATFGDNRQGVLLNDCFYLAALDEIQHINPGYLSRNYQPLSDGTVNVIYYRDGAPVTINVTSAINPVFGDPTTPYDDSNGNGAGAILLKAYAYYRNPSSNTMADLNFGLPYESLVAFGLSAGLLNNTVGSISAAYGEGFAAVVDTGFLTPPGGVPNHSYPVWSIDPTHGTITLRSPWGDGYEDRGFNEFLTVDDAWLSKFSTEAYYGQFGGAAPQVATPEPASLALVAIGFILITNQRWRRKPSFN